MTDPTFWLSRDEVRSIDHRAEVYYGVSPLILMENAGRGCAELLIRLNPNRDPVFIFCGPGNNGGDGFVIARHLEIHGWPVTAILVAPKEQRGNGLKPKLTPDAMINFMIWETVHRFARIDPTTTDCKSFLENPFVDEHLHSAGWIVDAMFGIGLTRPLEGLYADIAGVISSTNVPVLAVDIPSGLDCDSGEPLGPTVRATHTATFVAPNKGFLNPQSREWTGEVHVVNIGAPRKLVDEYRALRHG